MEKLKAQYGKDQSGFTKAWTKEQMEAVGPFAQKVSQKHVLRA